MVRGVLSQYITRSFHILKSKLHTEQNRFQKSSDLKILLPKVLDYTHTGGTGRWVKKMNRTKTVLIINYYVHTYLKK